MPSLHAGMHRAHKGVRGGRKTRSKRVKCSQKDVQFGPRGGMYWIGSHGKKIYISPKSKCGREHLSQVEADQA